jgi:hypothetical protein
MTAEGKEKEGKAEDVVRRLKEKTRWRKTEPWMQLFRKGISQAYQSAGLTMWTTKLLLYLGPLRKGARSMTGTTPQ